MILRWGCLLPFPQETSPDDIRQHGLLCMLQFIVIRRELPRCNMRASQTGGSQHMLRPPGSRASLLNSEGLDSSAGVSRLAPIFHFCLSESDLRIGDSASGLARCRRLENARCKE